MLFDPKDFWQEHNFLTLEMAKLTQHRLNQFGKQIAKLRMDVRAEAAKHIDSSKFSEQDIIDRVDRFAMRMQRGYFKKK